MKNFNKLFLLFFSITITTLSKAQISGTVFRDFNGNGAKDNTASFNEPFVAGVTVKAFNAANIQLGATKTTDAVGAYNFTAVEISSTTKVRIEFSGLTTGDYNSFNGTGNGTNVQFVTAPNAATNYAINAPDDYWNNTVESDPVLAVIENKKGRNDGVYTGTFSMVQINNNTQSAANPANNAVVSVDTGQTTAARRGMTYGQTGSVYGLAYQQKSQRSFTTSVLKRGHSFGPQGAGGIYIASKGATYLAYSGSFTLQGVTPSNGGGALDFGSVTRVLAVNSASPTAGELANNNYLSGRAGGVLGSGNSDSRDNDAFAKIGKMSYGDIEADKATDKLYTINLFQRKLIVLDVESTPTATLNNASAATLSPLVRAYDLTTLPGWPTATGAGNIVRPYGVKIYKGVGYIGVVSDGSSTLSRADVDGYVLKFDPNNITAGFTTVLTIDFSQYGQLYGFQNFHMGPWVSTWAQAITQTGAGAPGPEYYAQPMIAGFEFNEDGSMDIAIRDRWGDQGVNYDYTAIPSATTTDHMQTTGMGDLLHCTKSGSSWAIENTTTQPAANTNGTSTSSSFGEGSSFGSTGKEYYADRSGDGNPENNEAGITKLMGTERIVTTVIDPMAQNTIIGSNYWSTQGVQWNNINTGVKTQWVRIEGGQATVDKSNGMGDLEFIITGQPLQIGNRIWLDANGNGIQDADETTAGVPTGTTVTLRSPGVDGIYGNGDDQTWTTTTDAAGNYYFSALSSADTRKPTSWTGIGNTLLPGYDYRIEVATPTGVQVTKSDAAANSIDNIDNDAVANGTNAFVTFNTSNTNHNFDIGFKALASIGDKVWLDNGVGTGGTANDGVQNGTEPGVAGVTVTLYQNGTDGLPGTPDDIILGTTVTDAYGNYLFDNLAASTNAATSYNVGFTLPANYQFTTQTNTQVTGTSDATNTTTTTGGSTAANGSDANATTGRTGSFWLAAGEAEKGADAGLIFNTPTLLNSIGDKVWYDTNGDGTQGGTEVGVAGVTVQLLNDVTGAVIATTITDANGNYIFTNLPASTNYKVKVIPPAGTVFTTTTGTTAGNATTDSDVNATLTAANYGTTTTVNTGAAGTQITGIDAGIRAQAANTASLGDKVWNDLNSNGTQDAGEPGIAGVTVNLYEDADGNGVLTGGELTPVRTAVTDAYGNYIFNNLVVTGSNKWQVEFVQPSGYNNTPILNNNSGSDATDSDITDNATDRTGFIRLRFDERNTSVDAGFVQAAPAGTLKLGDKVWRDDDSDGIQDATEPGVPGVTVTLCQNGPDGLPGTADDIIIGTTSTDVNGNYLFVNLAASTGATTYYNVKYSNIPAGFSFTTQTNTQTAAGANGTPTGGSTVANGNDANGLGKTGSYNLTADNLDVDAGIKQGTASGKGSLGNKVWVDLTGGTSNVQDANEPGVAGVTVKLYKDVNGDGIISGAELTAVATTTTNALGEYIFDNLDAGTYQVGFSTLPAGYTLVTKDAGTDDNVDSDGNALNTSVAGNTAAAGTSFTGLIALAQGEDNLSVDLGLTPPANTNTLGNFVWFDTNSDGLQTAGEPGVAGVLVTLVNAAGQPIAKDGTVLGAGAQPVTTTTDANGQYLFTGLSDGAFGVKFTNLPAGFDITTKSASNDLTGSDADRVSGTTGTVTLTYATGGTSRDNRSLDAGIISTRAALGNKVWDDLNGDGIQDANEPGVAGVTVILYASDGTTVISSTITDQNGNYLFGNLNAGTYVVGFSTLPAGKVFTAQDNVTGPDGDGANTATGGGDSDANPTTGKTAGITLSAGQVNLTVDAGIRSTPVATVGNRVWDDLNGDGIQTAGEPGIAGVLATLYDNTTGLPVGSAITDGNGNWLITNVPIGTYYVIFSNKPAGNFTIQDNGGVGTGGGTDSDTDSDVNASGQTGIFSVTPSTLNVKIDAGITSSMILPVVPLTNFTAIKQNNTSVLNFRIAQQVIGSVYSIERSVTGTSFTAIGTIAGTTATNYNYTDATPIQNAKNYYRIKEVDARGNISYSEVRMVKYTNDIKVEVYPIPAVSNINVTLNDALVNKAIIITLYNAQGQIVLYKQINNTSATETLNVSNIASGTYQLQITNNNEVVAKRNVMIVK